MWDLRAKLAGARTFIKTRAKPYVDSVGEEQAENVHLKVFCTFLGVILRTEYIKCIN